MIATTASLTKSLRIYCWVLYCRISCFIDRIKCILIPIPIKVPVPVPVPAPAPVPVPVPVPVQIIPIPILSHSDSDSDCDSDSSVVRRVRRGRACGAASADARWCSPPRTSFTWARWSDSRCRRWRCRDCSDSASAVPSPSPKVRVPHRRPHHRRRGLLRLIRNQQ